MHAWLCENPVGVDALSWKELPTPNPKPGEVLIEIKAASLNFPDLLIVQNKYQMKPPLPFVPGSEYAGTVVAVGEGVKHLQVGQNVACLSGTGGFGTHTIAPAALCMPLPSGFPAVDAAAFIMIYATSHHALVDRAQLKAGETVLVLGAAGGVGTAAIQIAKAAGARVIAAASTDEKCALCRELGADAQLRLRRARQPAVADQRRRGRVHHRRRGDHRQDQRAGDQRRRSRVLGCHQQSGQQDRSRAGVRGRGRVGRGQPVEHGENQARHVSAGRDLIDHERDRGDADRVGGPHLRHGRRGCQLHRARRRPGGQSHMVSPDAAKGPRKPH